jgi:uncharacterized protein (DUF362 family)
MKQFSRRDFLRMLALGAGSAAAAQVLAACGATSPASVKTRIPAPTPLPDSTYLAVARGGDDPEALTRAAVEAIGGIGRFVAKGSKVLIKPNLCISGRSYEYAVTTNPWVVGALVKLCKEAGAARILVFDNPTTGSSEDAFASSGIAQQVAAAGGQVEYVAAMKFTPVSLPGAQWLKQTYVYGEVLAADVLINVPIAKHHNLTGLTLGMKNQLGTLRDRPEMHAEIQHKLVDLAAFLRPTLTVVDAVRILTANGPTGGSLSDVQKLDTVIATHDPVAADAYTTRLFGWTDPNRLLNVKYGADAGIGRNDLENLAIKEISVG